MLSIFKYNRFSNSLMLFVYALVLRIPAFFAEGRTTLSEHSAIFESGIISWPSSNLIGQIVIAFLIFIQAAMINRVIIRNRVMLDINLYPGVFYILLMSFTPANYSMHLLVLVNFIIIISISEIYQVFKNLDTKGKIYNSGVLTSMAGLLYSPYIIFSFFNYISISALRSFKLRERIQLFLGLLSPIFICGVWYQWDKKIADYPRKLFVEHIDFLSFKNVHGQYDYIIAGIFLSITLWSIIHYRKYTSKKNMQAIKKVNILFWFLIFTGITAAVQLDVKITHLMLCAIPLSVFMAMTTSKSKNKTWMEVMHLTLFVGSLYLNAKMLAAI